MSETRETLKVEGSFVENIVSSHLPNIFIRKLKDKEKKGDVLVCVDGEESGVEIKKADGKKGATINQVRAYQEVPLVAIRGDKALVMQAHCVYKEAYLKGGRGQHGRDPGETVTLDFSTMSLKYGIIPINNVEEHIVSAIRKDRGDEIYYKRLVLLREIDEKIERLIEEKRTILTSTF